MEKKRIAVSGEVSSLYQEAAASGEGAKSRFFWQRIAEMDSVVSGAADEISRVYGISVEVKKDTEKLEQVASDNRSEAEKMSGEVSRCQF